jgi:hypothetical protein
MPALEPVNIDLISGDSYNLNFTIRDKAGAVVDITGCAFKYQIAKEVGKTAKVSKSTDVSGEIVILDAPNGRVRVVLKPADTAALKGDFIHELQMTDAGLDVSTVVQGACVIDNDQIQ